MSARYTTIGGKNNGRTHVPRRPISLGEPSRLERVTTWAAVGLVTFVGAYFAAQYLRAYVAAVLS